MPYRSRLPQKVTMHLIDAFRAFEKAGAFKPKCGYTQMAKIFRAGLKKSKVAELRDVVSSRNIDHNWMGRFVGDLPEAEEMKAKYVNPPPYQKKNDTQTSSESVESKRMGDVIDRVETLEKRQRDYEKLQDERHSATKRECNAFFDDIINVRDDFCTLKQDLQTTKDLLEKVRKWLHDMESADTATNQEK